MNVLEDDPEQAEAEYKEMNALCERVIERYRNSPGARRLAELLSNIRKLASAEE
jgi:hypothetical protein